MSQLSEKYGSPPRRHPAEIPMLVVAIIVTTGVLVAGTTLILTEALDGGPDKISEEGIVLLALPLIIWFKRGLMHGENRVQGVKLTPTQFPEAHAIVVDAARHHHLRKLPEAYVTLGNGEINAFVSGHGSRRYAVVSSDLFEVGGRLKDPETFRYIVGHELGHIAAGHASYWRQLGGSAAVLIPGMGTTLSRAQEYTADNYGYALTPQGSRGVTVLAAGKYLYRSVSFDELADRASTERGLFPFLANLLATHPVNVLRAAALRDRTKAGRLFFAENPQPGHRPEVPAAP